MRLFFLALLLLSSCGHPPGSPGEISAPSAYPTGSRHPLDGGHEVGNGGGLGEKNAWLALIQMKGFVSLALSSRSVTFTPEEKGWLEKIRQGLEGGGLAHAELHFLSGTKQPGVFSSDGKAHGMVLSARTAGSPGSEIWLNTDHLYAHSDEGPGRPIEIPAIASLLLDELAHQVEPSFQKESTHWRLDALCAKFARALSGFVLQADWNPAWLDDEWRASGDDVMGVVIQASSRRANSQVWIVDPEHAEDVTRDLVGYARCRYSYSDTRLGFSFRNLHWHQGQRNAEGKSHLTRLHAWMTTYCERHKDGTLYTSTRHVFLDVFLFKDAKQGGGWRFDPDFIRISVVGSAPGEDGSPLSQQMPQRPEFRAPLEEVERLLSLPSSGHY